MTHNVLTLKKGWFKKKEGFGPAHFFSPFDSFHGKSPEVLVHCLPSPLSYILIWNLININLSLVTYEQMQGSIAALERNYWRDIADQESITVQVDAPGCPPKTFSKLRSGLFTTSMKEK